MTTARPRTLPAHTARQLAPLDGVVIDDDEHVSDTVLYPDLPPVVVPGTALITVPRRYGVLTCPECAATPEEHRTDPLHLPHEERCAFGDEESELLARDAWRLARRGEPSFHRALAEVERDLLDTIDLTPTGRLITVHATPAPPRRRRALPGLAEEPALAHEITDTTEAGQ